MNYVSIFIDINKSFIDINKYGLNVKTACHRGLHITKNKDTKYIMEVGRE